MKRDVDAEELLRVISKEEIAIYGTGHIAKKFLKVLKQNHLERNISCFVISAIDKSMESKIEGITVRDADWLKAHKEIFVCIAVHEASKEEIVHTVQGAGIERYVWIYPYLYEWLLGMPVTRNAKVRLADILQTCQDDYRLAVRYAAIDNYFKKNTIGFEMYQKAQALHSSPKTAKERLVKFCELISEWEKNGYDKQSRISINEKYEIIDGNHRVALARYYHYREVICDIFPADISVSQLHGEKAMLTRNVLITGGFGMDELKLLDEINKEFR